MVVNERMTIPSQELRVSFSRSGGPGGQNVNKVATKVELRWAPHESTALAELPPAERQWLLGRLAAKLTATGDLVITSSRTRDQLKNRQDARGKLAEIIQQALRRPKKRRKTKPTAGAVRERLDQKKHRSRVKKDRQGSRYD